MDKGKMKAVLDAVSGLTYAEWRMISQEIERGFSQHLNRTALSAAEMDMISARMQIELEAYFKQ